MLCGLCCPSTTQAEGRPGQGASLEGHVQAHQQGMPQVTTVHWHFMAGPQRLAGRGPK